MDALSDILRPGWGSEQWINEGWQHISEEDRRFVKSRFDELFKDGLPFEIKGDKLLYIYTFSLLAQLEVLAIQVPLKFKSKLSNPVFQEQLHIQLLDEIFHGMVFTKIVYLLCEPYAKPPAYHPGIENICNFIRGEENPKIALTLLNLIGEGWIEEVFHSLEQCGIAPTVFSAILADERRHVSEADLYRDIGIPGRDIMLPKLAYMEEQLLINVILQGKYSQSVQKLLGPVASIRFIRALDAKYRKQLAKIDLEPSTRWQMIMKTSEHIAPDIIHLDKASNSISMSPMRKAFMAQWGNPDDPTMVGEFNLDISCIDFFNKAYPAGVLTNLMLQMVSLTLTRDPSFRLHLNHQKLVMMDNAYVGLVVKLPGCGDQMGTIVFENCHTMSVATLSVKINNAVRMMRYCYEKREEIEKKHPHLASIFENEIREAVQDVYLHPMFGNFFVTVSNIGQFGYTQTKSPLRRNEAMKVTLLSVERRLVWNKGTRQFEEKDILPVSVSADHRIYDGNSPFPIIMNQCFTDVFKRMLNDNKKSDIQELVKNEQLLGYIDEMIADNLETAYKALTLLQMIWFDFSDVVNQVHTNKLKWLMRILDKLEKC